MRLHVLAEACIQKITELIFYISTKFARGKLKLENQERRALSSLMLFKYTDPSAEKKSSLVPVKDIIRSFIFIFNAILRLNDILHGY